MTPRSPAQIAEIIKMTGVSGPELESLIKEAAEWGAKQERAQIDFFAGQTFQKQRIAELEAELAIAKQHLADLDPTLERVTSAASAPPPPPQQHCRYESGFGDGWRAGWREAKACNRDPGK